MNQEEGPTLDDLYDKVMLLEEKNCKAKLESDLFALREGRKDPSKAQPSDDTANGAQIETSTGKKKALDKGESREEHLRKKIQANKSELSHVHKELTALVEHDLVKTLPRARTSSLLVRRLSVDFSSDADTSLPIEHAH